ncbi:MAG: nitroreductase family protein, partial [Oscillospiraceae bacterium]|nr:nitroreductase family protein [Oscillospiraceae bacterium]
MMNEIENRRSIRKYRKDMPDRGLIDEILHAGMLAPSAKNRQPWKFLVYTEKSKEMLLGAMETGLIRMRDDSAVPQAAKAGLTDAFHTLGIMREAPVLVAVLNTGSGSPFAG